MVSLGEVKAIVAGVLQLGPEFDGFDADTPLLGGLPEFDSMAVVSVLTALEDNLGIIVDDDEVSADIFETLGSLQKFACAKLLT